MKWRFVFVIALASFFLIPAGARVFSAEQKTTPASSERKPARHSGTDKCAVCGMFVEKYPDWIAEVIYEDGSVVFFDGPKDLFTYYFNIKKYTPQKSREEIAAMYVTSYYTGAFINAATAFYVTGSDVMGPMGREFIPFSGDAEAREFMRDHKGEKIVAFKQLTPRLFDTNQ
jgi:copper chaperone NosL